MNFNQRDGNTDKECWPEFSVFKLFNIRFAALARALDKNISSNLFDPKTRSPGISNSSTNIVESTPNFCNAI